MNMLVTPGGGEIHYAIKNGSHVVVLCDPSLLARRGMATVEYKYVTCPRCHQAYADALAEDVRRRTQQDHRK